MYIVGVNKNEVDKMKNFYVIRELVDRTDIIPFYLQYERAKAYFNQMKKASIINI